MCVHRLLSRLTVKRMRERLRPLQYGTDRAAVLGRCGRREKRRRKVKVAWIW